MLSESREREREGERETRSPGWETQGQPSKPGQREVCAAKDQVSHHLLSFGGGWWWAVCCDPASPCCQLEMLAKVLQESHFVRGCIKMCTNLLSHQSPISVASSSSENTVLGWLVGLQFLSLFPSPCSLQDRGRRTAAG